jgi:hypothetical protein
MHGRGQSIDLGKTGLLSYVQADSRVVGEINRFIARIEKDVVKILADIPRGYDPTTPWPVDYGPYMHTANISFDNAGDWAAWAKGFITGDFPPPLLVLGDTEIAMEGMLRVYSTGYYEIEVQCDIVNESFSNPSGDWIGEWPGGTAYNLEGGWTVKKTGWARRPPDRPADPTDLP